MLMARDNLISTKLLMELTQTEQITFSSSKKQNNPKEKRWVRDEDEGN